MRLQFDLYLFILDKSQNHILYFQTNFIDDAVDRRDQYWLEVWIYKTIDKMQVFVNSTYSMFAFASVALPYM